MNNTAPRSTPAPPGKVRLVVNITPEMRHALHQRKIDEGIEIKEIVDRALRRELGMGKIEKKEAEKLR